MPHPVPPFLFKPMKKSAVPSSLALGGAVGGLAGERCHVQRDTPLAVVQRGHFILAAALETIHIIHFPMMGL